MVFTARVIGGGSTRRRTGRTDEARWFPLDDVAALPQVALVGIALGFRLDGYPAGS